MNVSATGIAVMVEVIRAVLVIVGSEKTNRA